MRLLITGGAGFVGSQLAFAFQENGEAEAITVFDNLRRRGSELNLPLFHQRGIRFLHGDIRNPSDLESIDRDFDVLIEASAEPSALAGLDGSPAYAVETNLGGTVNCLELARRRGAGVVFLSTSRVYSIRPLREIRLKEEETRFAIDAAQEIPGVTPAGITEEFPTHLPRSLYGATKLASELLVQEYADTYGVPAIIDRCGVIAGPGQFGRVDQGVFTLWVARHNFGRSLRYTGFGGAGKQVRDLLHPLDLYVLLRRQIPRLREFSGQVFNVGGGPEVSVSLREYTELCRQAVGRNVTVECTAATNPVDIPVYVSDCTRAREAFGWRPEYSADRIVADILSWIRANEAQLGPLLL